MDAAELRQLAAKLDAQVLELLALDLSKQGTWDHIEYATELLQAYAQTWAIAVRSRGAQLDPVKLNESVRYVIDTHLRIAEVRVKAAGVADR